MVDRPNILVLLSDQHQPGLLGCMGSPAITPALDRLAAEGVRCDRAYAQNPVCMPSRVSLHSGQYPHNHGVFGNGAVTPPLPGYLGHLREHGYRTAGIGKLHLPNVPQSWLRPQVDLYRACYWDDSGVPGTGPYFDLLRQRGMFDRQDVIDVKTCPIVHRRPLEDGRLSDLPWELSIEKWVADQAVETLTAWRGEPWAMHVSLPRPHHPLTPVAEFLGLYPEDIDPPATCEADPSHRPPHFRREVERGRNFAWPFEPPDRRAAFSRFWRHYLALVSQTDAAIGMILEALAATGQAERTIVVYTSDHGAYHGAHGILEKAPGICSELVCRVPMIWRLPGGPRGRVTRRFVELVDVAPTLVAMAGASPMRTCDGVDATRLLVEDAPLHAEAVTENPWSKAICWDRWRFVHYPPGMFGDEATGELYDLEADPDETRNLFGEPDYRPIVVDGRERLLNWLIRTTRVRSVMPVVDRNGPVGNPWTVGDGKEANDAGPALRHRRGIVNYL